MLATATSVPNWSISGSFSNCGAPPEKVMADAIVSAPISGRHPRRGECGAYSAMPGVRPTLTMAWKTISEIAARKR